ncbi:hypothetical protein PTSG_04607 [Salpingoeca rosetta]|uniref:Aldehyde oxidase n=1 Tax=Salpingoeca rosetta (strain ATCC 50818 / BSB-021) TaxID=946362 RepID=F2U7X3_SALR5|nr:uncharacterized protein PTSG_04607 [Salpingoeca rosetta]EGD72878.1 hypothetical protein PTSG_04607 [Salpingoeca rosetta]|eukprot:XP_004994700.1 hypothetical protein PTSG_04607 [Salpingoeca rosetta]
MKCERCNTRVKPAVELQPGSSYHGFCPTCNAKIVFKSDVPTKSTLTFTLNGKPQKVQNPDPDMTLNEYIRTIAGLKGTKLSCAEGGCGACVVAITKKDTASGKDVTVPANSCLRLLAACEGLQITTVEGIGSTRTKMHPVQKTLATHWGSQCGGCSSGMVMSMYSLLQRSPQPTKQEVEDCLDGNICRCTGYRPILDAFKSFAVDADFPASTDIEDMSGVYHTPCDKLPCGQACADQCSTDRKLARLKIAADTVSWIEPVDLDDLLSIVDSHKKDKYMLVFGNTSTGVFKDQNPTLKIDVSRLVALQSTNSDHDGTLHIGAGVTIAALIDYLIQQKALSDSFETLADHLKKVASTPIRSVASWAGNVMMVHDNPDFPSDIFTIMAGANATLTVNSKSQGTKTLNFFDFLQFDMAGWVITSLSIPALKKGDHFTTHKVMKRHENCHAYINAAILINLDSSNTVQGTPTMVFGGFTPYASKSTAAAKQLAGQKLTADLIQQAADTLAQEFQPDSPAPFASVPYRRSLLTTLFYKSMLAALPSISPKVASAAKPYVRPVTSGEQSYDTDPSLYPVSQPLPKVSAFMQTTGEAQYTDDAFIRPGSLFAAFVHAEQGNCTLASVDSSAALHMDGVVDVILGNDMGVTSPVGGDGPDQEPCLVKVGDRILFNGQAYAVVLATTQAKANAAAKLVTAKYTDVKPVITTLDDAIANKSFFDAQVPPVKTGKDIKTALQECDHVIEGEVSCGSQYHFYMETQTAMAFPTDDGGLELHASTQNVSDTQLFASQATGLPASKINVVMKRAGGSYGGKITRSWFTATVVAYAANKHNLPVRCVLELHSNMRLVGKRHPFKCVYKVGTLKSKLHAVDMQWYADAGAYVFDSDGTMGQGQTACDAAYYCPNWQVVSTVCQTNTPSNTATRAPGCLPAVYMMETVMDHLAKSLKVDPSTFRQNNVYQQGQITPTGMTLRYCSLSHLWSQFLDAIGYDARKKAVDQYNANNTWTKQGFAIAPNKYGLGVGGFYHVSTHVLVNGGDGTVAVTCGGNEIGQGLDTKLAQVVAQQLGLKMEQVAVHSNTSMLHGNNTPTGGSCTSDAVSYAAIDACQQINTALKPLRSKNPDASWEEIVGMAKDQGIDLGARGWCAKPGAEGGFDYNSYGMVANQVQVDILTGEVQILRTDILFDCGQSMNPAIDIGQVEGGYVMGLGYFLTEEILYDKKSGRLVTDGTWEYKPPSSKDIPIDFRVNLLKNAPNPVGVLRSKASGEPPTCMASSVVFAVKQAIESSLKERGEMPDYLAVNAPLTPENIQQLCKVSPKQFSV